MKRYLTVGPTQIHPIVKQVFVNAINNGIFSLSHRSAGFREIYDSTCDSLRNLLSIPADRRIFFLSSATECMERLLQGTVENKSYHFVNGCFAERFYNISKSLGKFPIANHVEFGEGFEPCNVQIDNDVEVICLTQNETSTGVMLNPESVCSLKEKYPDKLLLIDSVTGLPYSKFDYSKTDAVFFSVQKGFGLPPGLGVMIVSEDVINRASYLNGKSLSTGSYNSITELDKNAKKSETTITPNTVGIFLLGKVCESFLNTGIEKIRTETKQKAEMIYDAISKSPDVYSFVQEDKYKSVTTISAGCKIDSSVVINHLADYNLIVSQGYKSFSNNQIRIANFPVQTFEDIQKLCKHLPELSII